MCVQALPTILSLVGTGIQMASQNKAARDAQDAVVRGIREREGLRREADARVKQQIQNVAASNPEMERKQQADAFIDALRKAKVADGGVDLGTDLGGSDRFNADTRVARANALDEGRALSGRLAAIDAPALQRQREARMFNDAATDLSLIGDRASSLDFLTRLRTANAGQQNAGANALGQSLAAFGSAYAGRARPPKATPPTNQ